MPIPSAAMCGYVSAPSQASVHVSSSSGGFDSFGEALGDVFEAIGEGITSLFGGGSSGATPTHKPAPYDPYAPTTPGPTYADIENASLASTTSAGAGLQNPVVVERSGSEKVRDFIRRNDPPALTAARAVSTARRARRVTAAAPMRRWALSSTA